MNETTNTLIQHLADRIAAFTDDLKNAGFLFSVSGLTQQAVELFNLMNAQGGFATELASGLREITPVVPGRTKFASDAASVELIEARKCFIVRFLEASPEASPEASLENPEQASEAPQP